MRAKLHVRVGTREERGGGSGGDHAAGTPIAMQGRTAKGTATQPTNRGRRSEAQWESGAAHKGTLLPGRLRGATSPPQHGCTPQSRPAVAARCACCSRGGVPFRLRFSSGCVAPRNRPREKRACHGLRCFTLCVLVCVLCGDIFVFGRASLNVCAEKLAFLRISPCVRTYTSFCTALDTADRGGRQRARTRDAGLTVTRGTCMGT